jgi:hypothetical protein
MEKNTHPSLGLFLYREAPGDPPVEPTTKNLPTGPDPELDTSTPDDAGDNTLSTEPVEIDDEEDTATPESETPNEDPSNTGSTEEEPTATDEPSPEEEGPGADELTKRYRVAQLIQELIKVGEDMREVMEDFNSGNLPDESRKVYKVLLKTTNENIEKLTFVIHNRLKVMPYPQLLMVYLAIKTSLLQSSELLDALGGKQQ